MSQQKLSELEELQKELASLSPEARAYFDRAAKELAEKGKSPTAAALWNMDYKQQPVSVKEFLENDYYLGRVGKGLFPKWREELEYVLNSENEIVEWILSGAIGIGKTYVAVVALTYKLYCLTCLKSPATFHGLAEGSPLVFAFFNIFKYLAGDTSYGYFWSFMKVSPYFQELISGAEESGELSKLTNNIQLAVGASALHVLGQNVFGGLLDEANFGRDSGNPTEKGQIEQAYIGIRDRMASRFMDPLTAKMPGLLCLVSSHRDETDFLTRHVAVKSSDPHTHISSFAIWEVKPGFGTHKKFRVVVGDRRRRSEILPEEAIVPEGYTCIEVPEPFRKSFEDDIETALQNLAGVVTYGSKLLIPQRERVLESIEQCTPRRHPFTVETATIGVMDDTSLVSLLDLSRLTKIVDRESKQRAPLFYPEARRFIHYDLSKNGDCSGFGMGCLPRQKVVERVGHDGKVFKVRDWVLFMDFYLRIKALRGDEIDYSKLRELTVYLRDVLRFRIEQVSADSFQSVDGLQDLRKRGFKTVTFSVDKTPEPYLLVKRLHLEQRFDGYPYEPYIEEITRVKDLQVKGKRKIDHPDGGSKDVSDCVAAIAGQAFKMEGSENQPPLIDDPALLRRLPQAVNPAALEADLLMPQNYGEHPLAKFFPRRK